MYSLNSKNSLIVLGIILLLALTQCNKTTNNTAVERKPNILFILADDLGYEKLGCYSGLNTITPNLDKMASEGVLFERTYGSPVCTPSRMTIYTGSYTPRHKYTTVLPVHLGTKESVDFDNTFVTYAQLLRDSGYQTSVTGKWQLATLEYHPDHCKSAGFDSWCVWQIWKDGKKTLRHWNPTLNRDGKIWEATENDFGPDMLTEYVIDRMKEANEAGEPFMIHHNIMLPHWPIIETPDDREKGNEASLDNMISYLDKQVGILLSAIKELGISENTYVFFVGDNGTDVPYSRMTIHGEVTGGKSDLNDGGTHLPFIAYATGIILAGKKVNDLVDFADFFPTFCELAGVSIPRDANPDGISFVNPLTGIGKGSRKWVTSGVNDDFFVFNGEWRLHHKKDSLVDCRDLPIEKPADLNLQEAKDAKEYLLPILNRLRKL